MSTQTLWSVDLNIDDKNIQVEFDKINKTMSDDAIIMYLFDYGKQNPVLVKDWDKNIQWEKQQYGWLFCGEEELKWRRLSGNILRFVYLGSNNNLPQTPKAHRELTNLKEETAQMIAWGLFHKDSDDKGSFYEEGIARGNLKYPPEFYTKNSLASSPDQRLAFKIKKYINTDTGKLEFWRHFKMDWADKKKDRNN